MSRDGAPRAKEIVAMPWSLMPRQTTFAPFGGPSPRRARPWGWNVPPASPPPAAHARRDDASAATGRILPDAASDAPREHVRARRGDHGVAARGARRHARDGAVDC